MLMKLALNHPHLPNRLALRSLPRNETANTKERGWPQTIRTWAERHRQRQALASLDDRLLKDVGISRLEAEREISKPFWR